MQIAIKVAALMRSEQAWRRPMKLFEHVFGLVLLVILLRVDE